MPRLEYNLMSELDEIMMRNKSGRMDSSDKRAGQSDLSTFSSPIRKSSIVNNERKSSVDDLISLGTEQEQPVVFDPLLDTQRQQQNPHRRLSRTSNPSTGKYENYVPPGGSSQPQFRQFPASMTDQQGSSTTQPTRSADDLLSEYGLHFNSVSISSANPDRLLIIHLPANLLETFLPQPFHPAISTPASSITLAPPS
eukprot:TRINITY_DN35938_c0_g1_i1.p1 TRINITY_DN35938_c0_g1~~TRINITY_DN35938_c0_g1_i1.p1  ORF type:complete len:197 (-),score=60.76 TRINITY_DN35938_c0_g1_i1:178-768(-)